MFSVLRNEDLKEMLESNKESLKLEAMKRVVGVSASWQFTCILFKLLTALCLCVFSRLLNSSDEVGGLNVFICFQLIAKGKNASELFPAVVKNVASKNIEVRHY